MEHADLDFLISGRAAELKFPYDFKYRYHGVFFHFGKRGGVNYLKSIRSLRPIRFLIDMKQCPVKKYDAVINDFEPVSAWASHIKKVKCIAVSHQASFYSEKVPRPKKRNHLFEFGMQKFAPYSAAVGTHYKAYDEGICLPIIREELLGANVVEGNRVLVYLPAFADEILIEHFSKLSDQEWTIFSKKTERAYVSGNVEVYPVNREAYSKALIHAKAVVIGSGFQGTSEALYLGKKILSIPMFDQYEQLCNAAALEELGVEIVYRVDRDFPDVLKNWLNSDNRCHYRFQSDVGSMAQKILSLV